MDQTKTFIQITKKRREQLKKAKLVKRESYDSVIERLLKILNKK